MDSVDTTSVNTRGTVTPPLKSPSALRSLGKFRISLGHISRGARPQSRKSLPMCKQSHAFFLGGVLCGRRPRCKKNLICAAAVGCKSCVRPLYAAHAAGPDVIRRSGPNHTFELRAQRLQRVFPILARPFRIIPSSPRNFERFSTRIYAFSAMPLSFFPNNRASIGITASQHRPRNSGHFIGQRHGGQFGRRRSSNCISQRCLSGWVRACHSTATAPIMSNRRKYRSPRLEIEPSRSLPRCRTGL